MIRFSASILEKTDSQILQASGRDVLDTDTHSIKVGGILLNELRTALFRLL